MITIDEWTDAVSSLYQEISGWAQHQPGWTVAPAKAYEETVGGKEVPRSEDKECLMITTPKGSVRLEPLGVRKDGRGIVEMYAWTTLVRVRLLHKPKHKSWEVITDSGLPFHLEWNEKNFVRLVNDLLTAL